MRKKQKEWGVAEQVPPHSSGRHLEASKKSLKRNEFFTDTWSASACQSWQGNKKVLPLFRHDFFAGLLWPKAKLHPNL